MGMRFATEGLEVAPKLATSVLDTWTTLLAGHRRGSASEGEEMRKKSAKSD